jgi:drug/metabolite transporter (DMT)-like permease
MVNLTKWLGLVATLSGLVVIALPAVFSVPHSQALVSLLLGEIAAIALAHSAYRASSGKQASPVAIVTAVVCGLGLLVSPLVLAPTDPFLTVMLVLSGVIVASGVAAAVERIRGGSEGRQTGAQRVSGN